MSIFEFGIEAWILGAKKQQPKLIILLGLILVVFGQVNYCRTSIPNKSISLS